MSSVQIQAVLKGAIAQLSEGDPAAALESLMPIYGTMEHDPKFLRLIADAALRANQREHAIAPLRQLAQIDITDHAVHATLGDLLRQSKDFQGAMFHLAQSLKLQPKKPEYLFNLGICLIEVGELKRAEAAFRTALEYRSDYAKAAFGLARSLEAQNDLVGAEKVLLSMLVDRSTDTNLWFRLAKNRHERGLHEPTLEALDKLISLPSTDPAILDQSLRMLLALGQIEKASAWLVREGSHYPGHRALSALSANLKQELGEADYLEIYEAQPFAQLSIGMQCDYLTLLSLTSQGERGLLALHSTYGEVLHEWPEEMIEPYFQLLDSVNRHEDLLASIDAASIEDSISVLWRLQALIGLQRYEEAADVSEALPDGLLDDQYALALRDTARHLSAPRTFDLPIPHEVYDLSEEMTATELYELNLLVERQLDRLHGFSRAPLGQSVVGGTQSPGHLFSVPNRYLDALKQRLMQYLRRALLDKRLFSGEHEFDRRRGSNFSMSASWSIKVREEGRHVPHVHSKGWLSCVYYVAVPTTIAERKSSDHNAHAGWLGLGRPGVYTGLDHQPLAFVKPQAGRLVVFPSYVWHETLPFQGEGERVVIAFDLVPSSS